MADALDLKSNGRKAVRVRVPPPGFLWTTFRANTIARLLCSSGGHLLPSRFPTRSEQLISQIQDHGHPGVRLTLGAFPLDRWAAKLLRPPRRTTHPAVTGSLVTIPQTR